MKARNPRSQIRRVSTFDITEMPLTEHARRLARIGK
jgi:hypothetical protein